MRRICLGTGIRFRTVRIVSLRQDFILENRVTRARSTIVTRISKSTLILEFILAGLKDGMYRIEQRNKFSVGETVEIMKPDGQNVEVTVEKIIDEDGQEQESAPHPKQVLYVALSGEASVYDILRRQEDVTE